MDTAKRGRDSVQFTYDNGRVRACNESDTPVTDVFLGFHPQGLRVEPTSVRIAAMEPGDRVEVAVVAPYDPSRPGTNMRTQVAAITACFCIDGQEFVRKPDLHVKFASDGSSTAIEQDWS